MNKKRLVTSIIGQLEKDLLALKAAAQATYEAATHEEAKPENEYDTRGLEASYLAGAQAKRAGEIDEVLSLFRTTEFKEFGPDDGIAATAFVEVESQGKRQFVFLMPKGGGVTLPFEGHLIQVITPHSALGEALLDLTVGDSVEVDIGDKTRAYKVLSVQ